MIRQDVGRQKQDRAIWNRWASLTHRGDYDSYKLFNFVNRDTFFIRRLWQRLDMAILLAADKDKPRLQKARKVAWSATILLPIVCVLGGLLLNENTDTSMLASMVLAGIVMLLTRWFVGMWVSGQLGMVEAPLDDSQSMDVNSVLNRMEYHFAVADGVIFSDPTFEKRGKNWLLYSQGYRMTQEAEGTSSRPVVDEGTYVASGNQAESFEPAADERFREGPEDEHAGLFMRNHYVAFSETQLGGAIGSGTYRFTSRCPGGDLHHLKLVPLQVLRNTARTVAAGLAVMHGKGIIHGDLKSGQLFLNGEEVKHADFLNTQRGVFDRKTSYHRVYTAMNVSGRLVNRAAHGNAEVAHKDRTIQAQVKRREGRMLAAVQRVANLDSEVDAVTVFHARNQQAISAQENADGAGSERLEATPALFEDDIYAAGLTLLDVAVKCPDLWESQHATERQGLFAIIAGCLAVASQVPESRQEAIERGDALKEKVDAWLLSRG